MVKSALCISEMMIQQINDLGEQKLSSGLRSLNQPNISIGLQVFHNLGIDKLNNIIKIILHNAEII